MINKNNNLISVVIATLGGTSLQETINSINNSSIRIAEIIVIIPRKYKYRINNLKAQNLRIAFSNVKGQVHQRCEGFKLCNYEYVIQLDDDIILDTDCIETLLLASYDMPPNSAFSPSLYFLNTKTSVYERNLPLSFKFKFYYLILNGYNGYKEGEITKAGTEIGINSKGQNRKIIESKWLPGGMILHKKRNLVLHDYFQFNGKAYCEDLYHSFELREKGINLYIVLDSIAFINDPRFDNQVSISKWFNEMKKDYKIRRILVKKMNKSLIRMFLFYAINSINFLFKKLNDI